LREADDGPADMPEHEPFIDSLTSRHAVPLGGPFDETPATGVSAAYVLRCDSLADAQAVFATDPLVTSGAAVPVVVRWDLVGIDTAAIEPELAV
jgi:uncharacterized protein YciI